MTSQSRQMLIGIVMVIASLCGGGWAAYRVSPFLGAGILLTGTGIAVLVMGGRRGCIRLAAVCILLVAGVPALLIGGHQLRCWHQSRPSPTTQQLFQGVEYIREVLTEPDATVVHLLKVDLTTPGLRVLITPPDDPESELPIRRRMTSEFVREFKVQAAINASNFLPFDRNSPWTYWPNSAERKTIVGGAASDGVQYSEPNKHYPILHITADNTASIDWNRPRPWHTATAGVKHFIVDGKPILMKPGDPRSTTAVGIDVSGKVLFLVVADGGQPPYSTGIDRPTLTKLLQRHGVHNALGLDGGGSSTMVVADSAGATRVVNRPVQAGVPGVERPVANHLGIYAPPLK